MTLAHVHLLLNHFPTIGMIVGMGLLFTGLAGKNNELKRAGMVIFLGLALLTIPTYITGNTAREEICHTPANTSDTACPAPYPGVTEAAVEAHEAAAVPGLAVMEITGAFAWLGLWQLRRTKRVPILNQAILVILSIATFLLMLRAASLGGAIRHPEIDAGAVA